jgi:acetyl-CoA acetyltransferase
MAQSDTDASTPKYLRNKYAIAGVGETSYRRGSQETTRNLATWAINNAIDDAGLTAGDIDGMLSYSGNDSTFSTFVAGDLGIRLNFYMDVHGGGSSTEALIGIAIGVIEAGMCKTVAIFRAMNGYTQVRIGGTGARSAAPITGDQVHMRAYGWQSAGQNFAPTFMRHMYDYGTTPEQLAHVKVAHSNHASNNPKAYYKNRVTLAIDTHRLPRVNMRAATARDFGALAAKLTSPAGDLPLARAIAGRMLWFSCACSFTPYALRVAAVEP